MSQYLLGIRPDFDGLIIEPCISKGISEFKITRKFRGTIYNISVKNIGEGTVKITADNGVVNGTTVSSDAEICNVEVVNVMNFNIPDLGIIDDSSDFAFSPPLQTEGLSPVRKA